MFNTESFFTKKILCYKKVRTFLYNRCQLLLLYHNVMISFAYHIFVEKYVKKMKI